MGRVTRLAVNEGDRVKRRTVPAADRSGQRRERGAPRRRRGRRRPHRARTVARRAAERPRQPRRGAPEPEAPAGTVGGGPDDARDARAGRRPRSRCARAICKRARAGNQERARRSSTSSRPGSTSSQHTLAQVALRVAVRRHRHAAQRRSRRERGRRHDEQCRHGAADGRRHVGHRGRSRSRRDRHPARAARAARQGHDRRHCRPGRSPGTVTEIGNSPIQTARRRRRTRTATNFKVVVTIDGQIPEVRPGFTCTAEITTATRSRPSPCRFRR